MMDRADLVFDSHVKQRVKAVAIGVSRMEIHYPPISGYCTISATNVPLYTSYNCKSSLVQTGPL
jgi:hypothetical protein